MIPAKLTFVSFSLKIVDPIVTESKTIQILLSPNTMELSNLLLFKAKIKKSNDPKLAAPRMVPPMISAKLNPAEIDLRLSKV